MDEDERGSRRKEPRRGIITPLLSPKTCLSPQKKEARAYREMFVRLRPRHVAGAMFVVVAALTNDGATSVSRVQRRTDPTLIRDSDSLGLA